MKKTIKLLDLDCGHCAAKIETAVKKIDGVTNVSVNFMNQKMILEAPDDKFDAILTEAKALIKKNRAGCNCKGINEAGHRLPYPGSWCFYIRKETIDYDTKAKTFACTNCHSGNSIFCRKPVLPS